MNDQDQLNEPDNDGAYTHVTEVSATELMQNDILPRSLQQPLKAFEDFWGGFPGLPIIPFQSLIAFGSI